jgi:hypothetical protein
MRNCLPEPYFGEVAIGPAVLPQSLLEIGDQVVSVLDAH